MKNTTAYKNGVKWRKQWYTDLKKMDECKSMLDGVRNAVSALTDLTENNSVLEEQAKKKRRLLKTLSPYTGSGTSTNGGVTKFKGWSGEGHMLFQSYNKMLKLEQQSGAIEVWEKAYRIIFKEEEGKKKSRSEREKIDMDLSIVWEL
jgi:hypothetical protein